MSHHHEAGHGAGTGASATDGSTWPNVMVVAPHQARGPLPHLRRSSSTHQRHPGGGGLPAGPDASANSEREREAPRLQSRRSASAERGAWVSSFFFAPPRMHRKPAHQRLASWLSARGDAPNTHPRRCRRRRPSPRRSAGCRFPSPTGRRTRRARRTRTTTCRWRAPRTGSTRRERCAARHRSSIRHVRCRCGQPLEVLGRMSHCGQPLEARGRGRLVSLQAAREQEEGHLPGGVQAKEEDAGADAVQVTGRACGRTQRTGDVGMRDAGQGMTTSATWVLALATQVYRRRPLARCGVAPLATP